MIHEQNGTVPYKLLEYNNLKVEEHNNPIKMVSMVHKEESMTLSTDSWKPLNQWSKWKRIKKNRDILMGLHGTRKPKCLH